jgi:hypothetical protein
MTPEVRQAAVDQLTEEMKLAVNFIAREQMPDEFPSDVSDDEVFVRLFASDFVNEVLPKLGTLEDITDPMLGLVLPGAGVPGGNLHQAVESALHLTVKWVGALVVYRANLLARLGAGNESTFLAALLGSAHGVPASVLEEIGASAWTDPHAMLDAVKSLREKSKLSAADCKRLLDLVDGLSINARADSKSFSAACAKEAEKLGTAAAKKK